MSDEFERVPCDDGMCTGVIGADGRCGTCHKPGARAPALATTEEISAESEAPAVAPTVDEAPAPETPSEAHEPPPDGEERVLCPDGMCTGILSADGRCGTCGTLGSAH